MIRGIKKFVFVLLITGLPGIVKVQAQIPVLGDSNYIEIGNWNVEWFGNTLNGPSNETLQQNNVYNVINNTNLDLWGLCEVSDSTAWKNLLSKLPAYSGVISTWSQTQKTAIIYKKEHFKLLYSKHILAEYDREFASGRLPLEAAFEVNFKNKKDTLITFVLHLKANTGSNSEKATAYDLRKRSSQFLKEYIDARYLNKNYIILGDWNDDLDESIYNSLTTPFSVMLADTTDYFFTSLSLTKAGKKSTVSYSNMIDHQSISKRMKYFYKPGSAEVVYMGSYITSYGSNTSDHYPVYSKYDFTKQVPASTNNIYQRKNTVQNPVVFINGKLSLVNGQPQDKLMVYDLSGRIVANGNFIQNQIYLYKIITVNGDTYSGKFYYNN